ncbi:hypothetical protein PybrP1_003720 [[Pythium] brassicae (nom. inval.)]|nr:hypothetical protein PybrP1_003720 [[Pythium] brassicae (nom. inval.)]
MDSTYRANRYSMPLLQVAGQMNTGRRQELHRFPALHAHGEERRLPMGAPAAQPSVVVTDRELALVNTLAQVYPATRHILRAWHIARNIRAKRKAEFTAIGDECSIS